MDKRRLTSIMLTILGALCVLAVCIIVGRIQAHKLEQRRFFLQGVHQGLLALMREIDYAATPMHQALPRSAQMAGLASNLYLQTAKHLKNGNGCTAGDAWQKTLGELDVINIEDKKLLSLIGDGLGMSDTSQQIKSMELSRQRIEKAESEAYDQAQRMGKIWKTLGWSSGAVLVLLLI